MREPGQLFVGKVVWTAPRNCDSASFGRRALAVDDAVAYRERFTVRNLGVGSAVYRCFVQELDLGSGSGESPAAKRSTHQRWRFIFCFHDLNHYRLAVGFGARRTSWKSKSSGELARRRG